MGVRVGGRGGGGLLFCARLEFLSKGKWQSIVQGAKRTLYFANVLPLERSESISWSTAFVRISCPWFALKFLQSGALSLNFFPSFQEEMDFSTLNSIKY